MKRILYIEDELIHRKAFFRALKDESYIVDMAETFDQASEFLKLNSYDYVVSDHHVGADNLVEELDHFKNENLIVLTSNKQSPELANLLTFEKPFCPSMLNGKEDHQNAREGLAQLRELCGEDEEALDEMRQLIETDLGSALSALPELVSANKQTDLANLIHKSLSKIGILGMSNERGTLFAFENKLRADQSLSSAEQKDLAQILQKALNLIKQT